MIVRFVHDDKIFVDPALEVKFSKRSFPMHKRDEKGIYSMKSRRRWRLFASHAVTVA